MKIRYEGYGAGGTAFIAYVLTDNLNRTASKSEQRSVNLVVSGRNWIIQFHV